MNIKEKLQQLELSLLSPKVRTSYKQLDMLLDDDFLEYGSSGKEYTKSMVLERLPSSASLVYTLSNFSIYKLSETVIQTRFITERENTDGTVTMSVRSSIWRDNDGNWQMLYHQGTPISSQ